MSDALALADLGVPFSSGGLTGQDGPAPIGQLSRKQKAAIVIRAVLAAGGNISLASLPEKMQAAIVKQMAELKHVDAETTRAVLDEFQALFNQSGLAFPGKLEGALSLLDGTVSANTLTHIRKGAGLALHANPWVKVNDAETDRLIAIVKAESTEVGAVILSKIKVSKAADILAALPGEQARRLAYTVSLTGAISPETADRIGDAVADQLDVRVVSAFDDGPVERVGAILNFSPAATREDVLDGLDKADAVFAREVRKAIFTFANIPTRVDKRDVPKITKEVEQPRLIQALAHAATAAPQAAEFILSNLSQRMSAQLQEEITAVGKVKERDGEEAMTAVVAAIRSLEAAGALMLLTEEEQEEA